MYKLILASSLLAIAGQGLAEETKRWSGEGELGYTMTSGNTKNETLAAKLGLNYKNAPWGNQLKVEALRTESETTDDATGEKMDEVTADRYTITDKLTRDINEALYSFLNLRYEDDEFSGFEYQSNATVGLGWHAINTDATKLDFEIGAGYKKDKVALAEGETTDDLHPEGKVARFYEQLSHKLTATTHLSQSLLMEGNDDNTHSELDLGLKVKINGALALKLSHLIKHNSTVPEGTDHYDRTSTVTLVYGF